MEQEWKLCRKQQYEMEICRARADKVYNTPRAGEVYNYLEDVTERIGEGHYVARGTVGELYLVPRAKLAAYDVEPDAVGEQWVRVRTKPSAALYYCRLLEGRVDVPSAYGVMHANRPGVAHGAGDRLLCMAVPTDEGYRPDEADCWVVNGEVFERTYRLV